MSKLAIIDMYNQGWRNKEIAHKLGLNTRQVDHTIRQLITSDKTKLRKSQIRHEAIIAMYRASIGISTIAEMLHIQEPAVLVHLRKEGIVMREVNKEREKLKEKDPIKRINKKDANVKRDFKIKQLWENGMTDREIAEAMNITRNIVISVRNRYGQNWRRQHLLNLSPLSTG